MANTIALATKYQPILDEIYSAGIKTAIFEQGALVDANFDGGNAVKVYSLSFDSGLGNYDRTNGYNTGNVTGAWQTLTLTQDRSKELCVDRMDDEETLDLTVANLFSEYMKGYITPEIDAYRFAKIASANNVVSNTAAVNNTSVLKLIDQAQTTLTDAGVPTEGRVIFMNSTVYNLLKNNAATAMRFADGSDINRHFKTFDGMEVVLVPQTRFYDSIAIDANNGYGVVINSSNTSVVDSMNIQFIICDPKAVIAVKKHAKLKIFDPDANQDKDQWKIQYRIYHDCFVPENKAKGIYVQKVAHTDLE
jgi:hypothetical protein